MAHRETEELVKRIKSAGYDVVINGQGHYQVLGTKDAGTEGAMYGTFSATPSSSRSLTNAISDLRKSTGVDFRVQRRTPKKDARVTDTGPDPRRLALLADRERNNKLLLAAQERAAAEAVSVRMADLKNALESEETRMRDHNTRVRTKEELDQEAVDRAVERVLAQAPASGNKKYPVLQPPRLVTFTPDEMQEMLDVSVCNTRPAQPSIVKKYRGRMEKGLWRITHQGVAVDWHGCVLDGRQRMLAAIAAGMELTIYVTYGMDPSAFFAMDDGKNRTAADAISMADLHWFTTGADGKRKEMKPNRTALAAAIGLCMNLDFRYDDGTMKSRSDMELNTYSREELIDALRITDDDGMWEEGPYFDLGYLTSMAGDLRRNVSMTMTAAYASLFMTHREYPEGPHGIWHNQLVTGANLTERSPALKLIKAMANQAKKGTRANSRGGMTSLGQYAMYVKAWNMFVAGRSVDQLRWREDEDVPMPFNPDARPATRRRTR